MSAYFWMYRIPANALGAPASRRLTDANAGDFRINQKAAAAFLDIGEQWLKCEEMSRRVAGAPRGKRGQVVVRTHV
jgi:hypothetical protein